MEIWENWESTLLYGNYWNIWPRYDWRKQYDIAKGSVVTKDIPEGVVVAEVPAKIIGSFDDFAKKRILNTEGAPEKEDW